MYGVPLLAVFASSSISMHFSSLPLYPPLLSKPYTHLSSTQRALNFYQAADNSPMTEAVNQKWTQKIWVGHFPQ